MEVDIENVVVKSNPRKNFGDIDELAASIKDKGVLEDLLVLDVGGGKYELVAGERRLRAAKAAGLGTVPVKLFSGDGAAVEEVKLEENMHRKGLDPVEEGEAFQDYIDATKVSVETLAKKVSKPKLYVERRLALTDLPKLVKQAVVDGKLVLGHALLISRVKDYKEQLKLMKKIGDEGLSVGEAERSFQHGNSAAELRYARFDKTECKGCRHNGGEQAVLFDSGSDLKGVCMDAKCFLRKQAEHHKAEVKKLKDQGIKVLPIEKVMEIKQRERVSSWDADYKKVLAKLPKEPENYVVTFEKRHGGKFDKEVWCINPSARHPKKVAAKDDKQKAADAVGRLRARVSEHKRLFLIAKTQELAKPSTKVTKALALFALILEGNSWNDRDRRDVLGGILDKEKIDTEGGYSPVNFSDLLTRDESDIDRITAAVAGLWAKNLGDELGKGAEAFGVSLKDHFQVSEDYLKFHTKDQLVALAKEFGLDKHFEANGYDKWDKAKKPDLVKGFLESGFDLKGKVPKAFLDAR